MKQQTLATGKKKKISESPAAAPEVQQELSEQAKAVLLASGILIALVVSCYANSLANGFVFDDYGHLLDNKLVRSITNAPKLLVTAERPLRDISYALDFSLWGERPFGFHLTNILFHIANTLLVFWLIRRFTAEVLPSVLAAAIFALHPMQADTVAYISGRRDLLFSFFYLLSFHCFLTYRSLQSDREQPSSGRFGKGTYVTLFFFLWVLSLLSKEMAASLPVFIFVWGFSENWGEQTGSWARRAWKTARTVLARDKWLYLGQLLILVASTYYSVVVTKASQRADSSGFEYWGGSFYTNLLTVIRVHAWYLKQLVFPTPIVQYSGGFDISTTWLDWRVWVSLIVGGGVIAAGFVLLNRRRLMAFAILGYFVLLLPVSQIIPHHELLADHYLYLPLMCFGLLVALLAREVSARGETSKRAIYATACLVVITFAVLTGLRNRVYKDELTLWQTNVKEAPNSVRALSSLAGQYAKSDPAKARELFRQCLAIDPSYGAAYMSLAFLCQTNEQAQEVETLAGNALTLPDSKIISPGYKDPRRFRSEVTTALAIVKGFQKKPLEAEALLLSAIDLYPTFPQPYAMLATYYHNQDRDKELDILKKHLEADPDNYDALITLAFRYIESKKFDEAKPYLTRILTTLPADFYANYELAQIYRTQADCAKALPYLRAARAAASSPEEMRTAKEAVSKYQQLCGAQ